MKKLLKKVVLPLFCISASVLAFTACNPQTDEPGPGPGPEPTETLRDLEADVTFWTNLWDGSDSDKPKMEWLNGKIEEFNKLYPNITVTWEQSGDYDMIKESIDQVINTPRSLPSIAVCYPDYVYGWLELGAPINDMTPYMESSEYGLGKTIDLEGNVIDDATSNADDLVDSFIEEGQNFQKEGTYSLPWVRTSEVMYYNDDVFTEKGYEVPSTWTEMITLARQMRTDFPEIFTNENKGNAGTGAVAPIGYDSHDNMIISFLEMMGVPYAGNEDLNGDGKLGRSEAILFDNAEFRSVLKMVKGWYDEGLITIDPTLVFDEPWDHYINEPFTGDPENGIAPSSFMVLNSTTGASWCANDTFVPSVAPMPTIDKSILTGGTVAENDAKVMSQGPSVTFFNKGEDENLAAWLFFKFITTSDNTAVYSTLYGGAPIRESSYENEAITAIKEKSDKSTVTTGDGEYQDATDYMLANIYGIYDDYSTNGQMFTAPASQFSSSIRTALGNCLLETLTSKETGAALDAKIDEIVTKAAESI